MFKFLKKISQFLRAIQRADEKRKKRWLKIFTGLTMMIVLLLWFVYINFYSLPALQSSSKDQTKNSLNNKDESVSEIFKRGLNEIFSQIRSQLDMSKEILRKQIQKTNELIIENPNSTFLNVSTSSQTVTSTISTSTLDF